MVNPDPARSVPTSIRDDVGSPDLAGKRVVSTRITTIRSMSPESPETHGSPEVVTSVLTSEEQAALDPSSVLTALGEGNARFVGGRLTERDHLAQLPKAAEGQWPMAAVLSCVDSRVPVETVFDRGIGDLFVARVAGNFVNPDMLGSLEFACHVSGSKVIVVLGHESCGAVKGAIDGVELGNITEMLSKITPVVDQIEGVEGDRSSANGALVSAVVEANVRNTVARIRAESPLLAAMADEGSIAIVGAVYDLETGTVTFLD